MKKSESESTKEEMIITKFIEIRSEKEGDVINLTEKVNAEIDSVDLKEGFVIVFVSGSTGVVSTIEYESGVINDFNKALEKIAPKNIAYEHHMRWHDDNGRSHVKASLMGPSIVVPFKSSKMLLGTWQQLVFIELDTRPRKRSLVVQIIGE